MVKWNDRNACCQVSWISSPSYGKFVWGWCHPNRKEIAASDDAVRAASFICSNNWISVRLERLRQIECLKLFQAFNESSKKACWFTAVRFYMLGYKNTVSRGTLSGIREWLADGSIWTRRKDIVCRKMGKKNAAADLSNASGMETVKNVWSITKNQKNTRSLPVLNREKKTLLEKFG